MLHEVVRHEHPASANGADCLISASMPMLAGPAPACSLPAINLPHLPWVPVRSAGEGISSISKAFDFLRAPIIPRAISDSIIAAANISHSEIHDGFFVRNFIIEQLRETRRDEHQITAEFFESGAYEKL